MRCALCERESDLITYHHLIPRSRNGKTGETVLLCSSCHRQIHHLFTNKELAKQLNTVDKLRTHPEMEKFLKWLRKQDPNKRIKIRKRKI